MATDSDKEARTYAETFIAEGKKKLLDDTKSKLSLDDLFSQIKAGNVKELNLIIKADVQGSVEAVKQTSDQAFKRRSGCEGNSRRCWYDQ